MAVKVIKVAMAVATAVCLGSVSAQQAISVNFGQQGGSGSSQTESDTVKVQGRGVGENKTAALKDAYRDAIERAVGLYVDAETVANNDQIVKDQILTQSNAYITDYRELSTERIDVGFEVRILATVKKQALTTKLTGVMPAKTVRIENSGLQNAHAQLVTKEKRAEDAAALLKNALDGLNPMQSLMVASIRPETQKILTGDAAKINDKPLPANQVMLRYLFEVKLDRAKYFAEFMPHLKKVMDQISVTKPKEIRLTELMHHPGGGHDSRTDIVRHFMTWNENDKHGRRHYDARWSNNNVILFNPVHVYSVLWRGDNWVWSYSAGNDGDFYYRFFRDEYRPKTAGDSSSWRCNNIWVAQQDFSYPERMTEFLFAMITSLNADCSNGKVTIYELDKSMIDILTEWRRKLAGKGSCSESNKTSYNIVFLDKDGEEIGVYPWQIPNGILMNVRFAELRDQNAGMVYATPFVGCFGENMIEWRDFVLEKDQLTKVVSIKIEPVD